MSNTDSFIDEVNEEVRKDRLFALMRRYGWIAILLVLLLVGGAAFREYRLAQNRAAAQDTGDQILAALQLEEADARVAALAEVTSDGDVAAIVAMLAASGDADAGNAGLARAELQNIAQNGAISRHVRELAALKLVMLSADDMTLDERMIALTPLAAPGAPYRLLAEEQIALVEIAQGKPDAAIERLRLVSEDIEVTQGLRQRALDVIVALGGSNE